MSTDKPSMYIKTDKSKEKHKTRNNNKHIFAKNVRKTQSMAADNFHYIHETLLFTACFG